MRLTKANGFTKTTYIFLNQFSGNRRVYEKDGRFYITSNGRCIDVTEKRYYFYDEY